MTTLVVAEHDNASVRGATFNTVTGAKDGVMSADRGRYNIRQQLLEGFGRVFRHELVHARIRKRGEQGVGMCRRDGLAKEPVRFDQIGSPHGGDAARPLATAASGDFLLELGVRSVHGHLLGVPCGGVR